MIDRSKEWWLRLAASEGDSEVGAGMYKRLDTEATIREAKSGFSESAWAAGEKFVIDYYYKPGACSSFVDALEQSPSEVEDYIDLAQKVATLLDEKDKEFKGLLGKALGWHQDFYGQPLQAALDHISYRNEKKFTQADVDWARMYARSQYDEYNRSLKDELARQQHNYGKLSAKYATLKRVVRDLRAIINNFTK